jgi:hypothetical protein
VSREVKFPTYTPPEISIRHICRLRAAKSATLFDAPFPFCASPQKFLKKFRKIRENPLDNKGIFLYYV